ncbi:MAG: phosphatidylglycerophosphatase A [Tissierellia bacterium]|nr:phosphatidylglycerophosphatase A [Tissierellia bacterium]
MYSYNMDELNKQAIAGLKSKGVELHDIAKLVYFLQERYMEHLTMERCLENVEAVLRKREVIHAVLTGLAIDEVANKKLLPEPLQSIVENDEGLYGIDEVLPLGIVNIYGTIGLTNFGYLDKEKVGIIKDLDERKGNEVTTFTDDLVAAIAAAAASRLSHQNYEEEWGTKDVKRKIDE